MSRSASVELLTIDLRIGITDAFFLLRYTASRNSTYDDLFSRFGSSSNYGYGGAILGGTSNFHSKRASWRAAPQLFVVTFGLKL
jgi:hypothetical protein